MPLGRVVFIGAGPGAADLITVRGLRALEQAEVVLADALTDPALRAHAPHAQWIDVGKRGFAHATGQAHINALLVEHALAGRAVARLKGGDPSLFGRLEEELQVLAQAGIDCEVIPGVTAALAAAAQSQRPLTRRGGGRTVALTTAMTLQHALQAGHHADTEVFYMAGQQLPGLADSLLQCGWPDTTPVSVVSRAGCPDARSSLHTVASLAEATSAHAGRPAVVIVGVGATPAARAQPASLAAIDSHQSSEADRT